jgi:hypothetical protein
MNSGAAAPAYSRLRLALDARLALRLAVITGVLALSASIPSLLARAPSGLLLVFPAVGAAILFLRWPPLGLLALVAGSLLVPFSIGTGTRTSLNAAVLTLTLLLGLWAVRALRAGALWPVGSRPIAPLLAFGGVSVLAFIAGNRPWHAFGQSAPLATQIGGLAILLLSVAAFLLVAHQVRDLRWLQLLTWLFIGLGALYIAARLTPGLDGLIRPSFQRGAMGSVFWVWLVALALGQALCNRRLAMPVRVLLGVLVAMTLYVGLSYGRTWASGWLPPLVAALTVLWIRSPRFGLLTTVAGALLFIARRDELVSLLMAGDQAYSLMTRLEAWRLLAGIVEASPLLGLGPANYYWYTPLFPILGWYVSFNSHNNYVDLVAQTGLLGLACFCWFAWEQARLGWRLRTQAADGFAQAYVSAGLGGLAGMLVAAMLADWVLPFVYNVGLEGFRGSVLGWIFLGGLVVVEQTAERRA